jgi:bifunctional N-acetylglucosamine-1-phosphate-uridyltransferase/glucosamine-1-phosphate-acetyltransferase GlmU-like protein
MSTAPNRITLGYGVKIGDNCNFLGHGGIEIGGGTKIGDDVNIITVSHPSDPAYRSGFLKVAPVHIGRNVSVGAGEYYPKSSGKELWKFLIIRFCQRIHLAFRTVINIP